MSDEKDVVFEGVQMGYGPTMGHGFSVIIKSDGSGINFVVQPDFKKMMTDQRIVIGGRTVGRANQDTLHGYLQDWIDAALAEGQEVEE